jgi:hypothetical protein
MIAAVKDAKLPPAVQAKYLRAEQANENSFTNLSFFAAAIGELPAHNHKLPISFLTT